MEFYSEIDFGNQKEINHFKMITGRINRYFCQFLDLLDHPIESFNCCSNPEIVTLDGIVLHLLNSTKSMLRRLKVTLEKRVLLTKIILL